MAQTSLVRSPNSSRLVAAPLTTAAWLSTTPFGAPVEPDVYTIVAGTLPPGRRTSPAQGSPSSQSWVTGRMPAAPISTANGWNSSSTIVDVAPEV